MDRLGWFEERLIGFGEEDGDIVFRAEEDNNPIQDITINGIRDVGSQEYGNYERGIGKYTKLNTSWFWENKYKPSLDGICGMFGTPHKRICDNIRQYPTERFYWDNRDKL